MPPPLVAPAFNLWPARAMSSGVPSPHLPPPPPGDPSSSRLRRWEPCPRVGESGSGGEMPPPLPRSRPWAAATTRPWAAAATRPWAASAAGSLVLRSASADPAEGGRLRRRKPRPLVAARGFGCGRPGSAPLRSEEGGVAGGVADWRGWEGCGYGRPARPAPWEGEEEA
jgi:hypothetical protein